MLLNNIHTIINRFLTYLRDLSRRWLVRFSHERQKGTVNQSSPAEPVGGAHVHIVCYENLEDWILGKMSTKLFENLTARGVNCTLGNKPNPHAKINHHICYVNYDWAPSSLNTTMITHVDAPAAGELELLKTQMQTVDMGVCLSSYTMRYLVKHNIPKSKLCFINPAHDGDLHPRKIRVGIFSRIYWDGRKREQMLVELSKRISPDDFAFSIMGSGWDEIISELRQRGFEVDYHPQFSREHYERMLGTIDYYLYFGLDEGSMGFIDALACGVSTIVTNQGFHLDVPGGGQHLFSEMKQLERIFERIVAPKKKRENSVRDWTWENYANKHIAMWDSVTAKNRNR